MKKILTILCVLLSFAAAAQNNYTRFNTRGNWLGVATDAFNLPGLGTPALATAQIPRAGAMIYDSTGGNRGVHVWTGSGWVKMYDTLMSISASNTLQQVINNGPTISTNSTIPLAANLFIGDNIGIEFKNSTSTLELYGPTIKLNRGWSGAAGTLGLPAGAGTDSVVTIDQATGQLKMRNASSFGGGSVGTASNGITLTGSNFKLGGPIIDNTTLSFSNLRDMFLDSVRQFQIKTLGVIRFHVDAIGETNIKDNTGINLISIGSASVAATSNGLTSITGKGGAAVGLRDSAYIRTLAGDLRIYPLNHNYSSALTVTTYDTTNGRVYHTPISALAGSDLSTGSVYCPVYIDTIQDKTVINGATNTKDNSFPYVERTPTGKLVYGVYKGRAHGAGGATQYSTSTDNGVTVAAFTDFDTDTLYNWRNLIPSRLRGDTMGIISSAVTNGRLYLYRSINDFVSFSARDSIQVSGATNLFSEGKTVIFNGYNAMPVYTYSPDTDRAGVAYKTAFTGGTWAVTWFTNSTTLQMNEVCLVPDGDTLFAFIRSELNTTTLYKTWTVNLTTWATPVAVTCPEWIAGKPDVIKMPDGRYLMNGRSREVSPSTPDEGLIWISSDKGTTWTILHELRQEYYTYGNLLHMGDNTYLLAYSTQIPVPYASLYQMFFVVPSCDLNTNADQKVYEKYGAPFNILKDYIDRKAGLTIALTDGSVPFANTLGTGLSEDNTRFYWNNSTKTLSLGLNTAIGRLNVKAIGSNSGHGIAVIEDNSGANTGMNHESGVFTISPATDAAPTTYVARLKLYEPTATGSDPVVELGTAHFIGLQDGTVKIAKPFTQSGAGLFRIEGTGSVPGTGATGVGGEMFVAGGAFYIAPYNRTTSANAPLNLGGASVNISGIALNVGQVNVSTGNRINFAGNAGDLSSPVNGDLNYNTTTGKFRGRENGAWTDFTSNTSVGSGYKAAIGLTSNIKSFTAKYGITLDSATANEVGIKADTATLFPALRATIVQGSDSLVFYPIYPLYEVMDSMIAVDTGAGRSAVKTWVTTKHLVDSLITVKPAPTLQQVFATQSNTAVMTAVNTININSNDFWFMNGASPRMQIDGGSFGTAFYDNDGESILKLSFDGAGLFTLGNNVSSNKIDNSGNKMFITHPDSIILKATTGLYNVHNLKYTPGASTKMMVWDSLTSKWGTQPIPSAGSGDMVLASVQTVTGAKTFNDTKLLLRNVANTFNGSFVNTNTADRIYTLPNASGTVALTSGAGLPGEWVIACSDETTAITTGTAKVTFRVPFAATVTAVRASVNTVSSSGIPTFDINEAGTTILSTKLTIDASELTSVTAAAAAVISDTALADDAEITIDFDVSGTGAKGVKIIIYYTRN